MSDVRSAYSPGRKYFRQISRGSHETDQLNRLLFRGVIQTVDRVGSDERPRFSVQVKVIGFDGPSDKTDGRWFPPLFPIQQISLPEVGEEVLLICEEVGNINSAFWIARSVTQNTLTKNEIGAGIADQIDQDNQDSSSQYGYTGKLPTENDDQSPDKTYEIPEPRVKPGDTVIQGRSNSFTRHTFDTKNLNGVVETITEEQTVSDDTFYKDDFRSSSGAREVLATKADLDSQIIDQINQVKFDRDYTQNGGQQKLDTAYLLLEALELRLISRQGWGSTDKDNNKAGIQTGVQHFVLAEEQERWMKAIIDLTKELIDYLVEFSKQVSQHQHMAQGPTSPPLPPQAVYFSATTPSDLEKLRGAKDKSSDSTKYGDNYEGTKDYIKDHHSKTIAGN
jgi:hypothetical protein